MGACCQGATPPTQHEVQIEQNQSTKHETSEAKYNALSTNTPRSSPTIEISAQPVKKQASSSLPYKPRSPKKNGLVQLGSESAIFDIKNNELQNENKQLREELKNESNTWSGKYKKLQETLDNQALNYRKEIDLMSKQMTALRTELQETIITQQNAQNISTTNMDSDESKQEIKENTQNKNKPTEQQKNKIELETLTVADMDEKHNLLRHKSDIMRKTQLLDLTKELDILREQTNTLKADKIETQNVQIQTQKEYENTIKRLEAKIKSLEIVNEPHAKPSFAKKNAEQNKAVLSEKDKQIIMLKEELKQSQNKCNHIESELKAQMNENDLLFERSKTMTEQLNMDKESIKNELKLLKDKDEGFINKMYKQRDQYKRELYKMKKQFKERELTLKVEMEALERKKIKAEDLADLKNKTDEELREIIEKLRFTNRDLNDQVNENKASHDKRETEFDEQILGLNNIIKNLKSQNPNQSTRSIHGLSALAGAVTTPRSITAKQFAIPSPKTNSNKFGAAAAALAGKLPFGKKKKQSKNAAAANALNAAFLKKRGKTESKETEHKDDIKGAIGNLVASKQKESGQGPIVDDTKSILGMLDTMAKYNKMKKIGMPMASIKNKMKMDGFTASQIAKFAGEPPPKPLNGIDLSKHDLKKYEKMKKIGMPETSVRNKMKMDGFDKKIIATFFGEKLEEDEAGGGKPMEAPCPKPNMSKYTKMKKIGMPEVSVKNKMKMDAIDPYWVRDFWGEPQPIIGGGKRPMEAPCPKPDMAKYTKMKKVGLPVNSIKNKMKKDGIHPYWVRDFFGEPQPMIGGDEEQVMKEPCPKPEVAKYARMKKIGMPEISVRNKMKMDGIHAYWVRDFFGEPQPKIKKAGKKKKIKRKVKALHWRKKSDCDWTNTIWANIDTTIELKTITTEKLITPELSKILEAAFTNIRPKKKDNSKKKKDEKKEITLIDPKHAFNMIVGLRQFEKMGINDMKIRNYLLKLDDTKLTVEMLENLSKFVPSNEELEELRNFKGDKAKLGRAEKFTDVMTCLVDIKMRIDLWRFKIKFKANVFEVDSRMSKIQNTLDELKSSTQIASFLKICLIIGNFMNEGTNRGAAKGIKLESIDRFASLKTADNKQTMLMFILNFIYKNHNSSGQFDTFPQQLLDTVESAKKIEAKTIRDGIADMKDALGRIGKRITRTSRNLQQVQEQFYKSAGNVLVVFSKLKQNVTKLKAVKQNKTNKGSVKLIIPPTPDDDLARQNTIENSRVSGLFDIDVAAADALVEKENIKQKKNKNKKKRRKKKAKAISFVDELLFDVNEAKEKEKNSKYHDNHKAKNMNQKPRKFIIIDENYKGVNKIRTRKEKYEIDEHGFDGFNADMFTRGETMYESDADFHDITTEKKNNSNNIHKKKRKDSGHEKTNTGLKRKKKKLKKVKIRRMKRTFKKKFRKLESSRVSIKTKRTIDRLHELKEFEILRSELGMDDMKTQEKRKSLAVRRQKSVRQLQHEEDPTKPPKDKFESMMTGFHTMATNKVEALDKQFENLKIFAGNVAVFFGEHDDLEWEELFVLFMQFFEAINKAKKHNDELEKKAEKLRKKKERERLKQAKMAKRGLKPKVKGSGGGKKSEEPVNILEEIKMKNAKGTLQPSKAKNDIVGYEKDGKNGKKATKKKNGMAGMSLLDQIKSRGDK